MWTVTTYIKSMPLEGLAALIPQLLACVSRFEYNL